MLACCPLTGDNPTIHLPLAPRHWCCQVNGLGVWGRRAVGEVTKALFVNCAVIGYLISNKVYSRYDARISHLSNSKRFQAFSYRKLMTRGNYEIVISLYIIGITRWFKGPTGSTWSCHKCGKPSEHLYHFPEYSMIINKHWWIPSCIQIRSGLLTRKSTL